MQVRAAIERKLTEALAPTRLEVVDDSGRHAGHAGHRPAAGFGDRPHEVVRAAPPVNDRATW